MDRRSANINDLPNELLLNIFSYLSAEDLGVNVQSVCARWAELCVDDALWKDSFCSNLKYSSLQKTCNLLEKMPKLERFHMHRGEAEILQKVAECCKRLRFLRILYVYKLPAFEEAFEKLVLECAEMEELIAPVGLFVNERLVEHVGQWSKLCTITVTNMSQQPIHLKHIANGCPTLQHLDVGRSAWLYDDVKYFLEKKSTLLSLSISAVSVERRCVFPLLELCRDNLRQLQLLDDYVRSFMDYSSFGVLTILPNLKSLSIKILQALPQDVIANVFVGGGLSQLEELEMESIVVTASLFNIICNNCPNLLKVRLSSCPNLNLDSGLTNLHKCTNLMELDVSSCTCFAGVTALINIIKCSKLKYLNLGHSGINGVFMICLVALHDLRHLDVSGCRNVTLPFELLPYFLKKLTKLTLERRCYNTYRSKLRALCATMPYLRVYSVDT